MLTEPPICMPWSAECWIMRSRPDLVCWGARTLTVVVSFESMLAAGRRAGVQAARPRWAAAMVLSICRVIARQAARIGAGAAMGWSCAVRG
jgi:hypothetical protein